ncbi:vWA domain-containing protein [Micromonospora chalcea]|uniref:vWA domain-containing protein n=1 Tax=Micromonospora chalcea TaxID=1874 RepID=UPI0033EA1CC7
MAEPRGNLLPIYVVIDESASMHSEIDELNAGLSSLHDALLGEPMAAAKVRFSIIGFSDTASVRLHLADLRRLSGMPRVVSRGATNYSAALTELADRIPTDIAELKAKGFAVHRPAVFFLSDGMPTDGAVWKTIHARLVDRAHTPAAPNIIAFGIGQADPEVILELATKEEFAFVSIAGADVGGAISKFTAALTASVVHSGRSLGSSAPELVVERPEGFRMAIDVV